MAKPSHDEQNGDKVNTKWFGSGLLDSARKAASGHNKRLQEAGKRTPKPKKK